MVVEKTKQVSVATLLVALKKFPKTWHEQGVGSLDNYSTDEIQKWKEDFEGLLLQFQKQLQEKISSIDAKWKKHLFDEGGSCYCMASETPCSPDIIKHLEKVLGDVAK